MKRTSLICSIALTLLLSHSAWAGYHISCAGSAWRPGDDGLSAPGNSDQSLPREYLSNPAVGMISIWGGVPGGNWTVTVRQRTTGPGKWNPNLKLYVKRTSYGSGTAATIADDYSGYQLVRPTDAPFFHGTGQPTGITFQIKLTGVAPGRRLQDYASLIVFTVKP